MNEEGWTMKNRARGFSATLLMLLMLAAPLSAAAELTMLDEQGNVVQPNAIVWGGNPREEYSLVSGSYTLSGSSQSILDIHVNPNQEVVLMIDGVNVVTTDAAGMEIQSFGLLDLTIQGENCFEGKGSGIETAGEVVLKGTGTVVAAGENYGIRTYGSLTIDGLGVLAEGKAGVYIGENLIIENGADVKAIGSEGSGIEGTNAYNGEASLTVRNAMLTAEGESSVFFYNGGIAVKEGGKLTAKYGIHAQTLTADGTGTTVNVEAGEAEFCSAIVVDELSASDGAAISGAAKGEYGHGINASSISVTSGASLTGKSAKASGVSGGGVFAAGSGSVIYGEGKTSGIEASGFMMESGAYVYALGGVEGIDSSGSVSIKGAGTKLETAGGGVGITTYGHVNIENGAYVSAVSNNTDDSYYHRGIYAAGNIYISGNGTSVEAVGEYDGMASGDELTIADGAQVHASGLYAVSDVLTISGGAQVTSGCIDGKGISITGSGTSVFAKDDVYGLRGRNGQILTIEDGARVICEGDTAGIYLAGAMYVRDVNTALEAQGGNGIEISSANVYVEKGASLHAKATDAAGNGISGTGTLDISGPNVTAEGGEAGSGFDASMVKRKYYDGRNTALQHKASESADWTVYKGSGASSRYFRTVCGSVVTFDKGSGKGAMEAQIAEGTYVLPECTFEAPDGYVFTGWLVNGTIHKAGDSITVTRDVTAKAQWVYGQVILTLDPGRGYGTRRQIGGEYGKTFVLPECSFIPPWKMTFDGWLMSGEILQPGECFTMEQDETLYAIYKMTQEQEKAMNLPGALQVIGEEAFAQCDMQAVVIPQGCIYIGKRAFADCGNLIYVTIPESVAQIEDDAFEGCGALVIAAPEGSVAHGYALEHNMYWTLEQ